MGYDPNQPSQLGNQQPYPYPQPGATSPGVAPQAPPPGYPAQTPTSTYPGGPSHGGPSGAPPGAPPGYGGPPPGYGGQPPGAPKRKGSGGLIAFITTAVIVVLVIAVVSTILIVRSQSTAEAGEVFLEQADQPGTDPFTTSIPNTPLPPKAKATASTTTATTGAPPSGAATRTTVGSTPGLYGGTNNLQTCDPESVTVFLEQNPDKAAAWVQALNTDPRLQWSGGTRLRVTDIRTYIGELTSVSLASDTRVTNFGYANRQPTARQAVLQAGTAVLVDRYGVPRVKCACGNPLIPPAAQPKVRYTGPQWPGYSVTNIVVVQQSVTIIETFVLVNVDTGGQFQRPVGSSGSSDTTVDPTGTSTSSASTSPPSTTGASSTTRTTSSTSTTRPTSSTTPGPTQTLPADFCATYKGLVAKWTGVEGNDPKLLQELLSDLDKLAATAPSDMKADFEIVLQELDRWAANGGDSSYDPSAAAEAASDRLNAQIKARCG